MAGSVRECCFTGEDVSGVAGCYVNGGPRYMEERGIAQVFCSSCTGRRMADTAARLVKDVLPRVPVRQFVLSFPYEIRYRLAWDGELIAAVLKVFLRAVGCWYRRQAQALEYKDGRCGSVTFVQRFGSSLNVNPHLHVLIFDGSTSRETRGRNSCRRSR